MVTLILMGNPWMTVIILGTVLMIEASLVGVMALWEISLNAISIVNMAMAVGISIEFCFARHLLLIKLKEQRTNVHLRRSWIWVLVCLVVSL